MILRKNLSCFQSVFQGTFPMSPDLMKEPFQSQYDVALQEPHPLFNTRATIFRQAEQPLSKRFRNVEVFRLRVLPGRTVALVKNLTLA